MKAQAAGRLERLRNAAAENGIRTFLVRDTASIEWLTAFDGVFDDEQGVMNRNVQDINGEVLVVSQFTLMASYRKGNRPSWIRAARHEHAVPMYEAFVKRLTEDLPGRVQTGEFGAEMKVSLLNDGPVTICMDTKNKE